jgi:hypothetical protein
VAIPVAEAIEMMESGRGTQFDAELLDVFLGSRDIVLGIKERYSDGVPDPV